MKDLLPMLAAYLASKTSKTLGTDMFYNEMPDQVTECICIYEKPTNLGVPPQIDAQTHRVTVGIRSSSNILANDLAYRCYRWLLSDSPDYDIAKETVDSNGFIPLSEEVIIYMWLHGPPVWDKADSQGRKYYAFDATITTKR